MNTAHTKPGTCPKCKGTGDYLRASGAIDYCARCDGTGIVETDRATIRAKKEAYAARIAIVTELQTLAVGARKGYMLANAIDGLDLLRTNEPARYDKAVASIRSGHPGVVEALRAYYHANRPAAS